MAGGLHGLAGECGRQRVAAGRASGRGPAPIQLQFAAAQGVGGLQQPQHLEVVLVAVCFFWVVV